MNRAVYRTRRSGITILEVLIAAAIMTGIIATLWSLTSLGERTSATARTQAEALHRTMVLMRRLSRDVTRAERVLMPGMGTTAFNLVLRHPGGAIQIVEVVPSRKHIVSRNLTTNDVTVVADLSDTNVFFGGVQFISTEDGELQIHVTIVNTEGEPLPGLSGLICYLPRRRELS